MDAREVFDVEDGEEDCRREDVDQEEFCDGRVGEAGGEHSEFVVLGVGGCLWRRDEVWLLI